jgi:hypothetical protein
VEVAVLHSFGVDNTPSGQNTPESKMPFHKDDGAAGCCLS